MTRLLAVRLDSLGDMLVTGPGIRAMAAGGAEVTVLAGPRGTDAARMLPGVHDVWTWECPWILASPSPVDAGDIQALVERVREAAFDAALVFTSFHQSPLPTALLLRLAGVPWLGAISEDYPGSLLDLRHQVEDDLPEPVRALSLATAAGYSPAPPDGSLDPAGLDVRRDLPDLRALLPDQPYVVLHPGASVPARAWPRQRCAEAVEELADDGWQVVVTGTPDDQALCAEVAGRHGIDLSGQTPLVELAAVLAGSAAAVVANTGPAHLAAAVGTPVVSLFAPTVPAARWAPYGVPVALLGDQQAACRGSRAATCPVPGHPCLSSVTGRDVAAAVAKLTTGSGARRGDVQEGVR
jgi:ADP-heptose:LPS heptosyltransferase